MVKFTFLIFNLLSILNFYSIYSKMARCFMVPDNNSTISGEVKFIQENESSPVMIELKVFRAVSIHGFHIHEKGSIEGGCAAAGAHYNPLNKDHGGPDSLIRHMGDLGNVKTTLGDSIIYKFTNDRISLFGEYSIMGRTCVIHAKQDDLGMGNNEESKKTGNSGIRLACGVLQEYEPLMSAVFGLSFLILGLGFSIYYFFFVHNKKNHSEDESINLSIK